MVGPQRPAQTLSQNVNNYLFFQSAYVTTLWVYLARQEVLLHPAPEPTILSNNSNSSSIQIPGRALTKIY